MKFSPHSENRSEKIVLLGIGLLAGVATALTIFLIFGNGLVHLIDVVTAWLQLKATLAQARQRSTLPADGRVTH